MTDDRTFTVRNLYKYKGVKLETLTKGQLIEILYRILRLESGNSPVVSVVPDNGALPPSNADQPSHPFV